ncbi:hypothetical protein D3C80_1101760 [compost metagenome]
MPRQPANGQSQNASFVTHARPGQPLAQSRMLLTDTLFELAGRTRGARLPFAPQRTGRVQVKNRQARIGTFGLARRKKAAAVGKRQQITDLGLLPAAIGDTLGQHLVEQIAAGAGKQPRTDVTLFWQRLAAGPVAGIVHIATAMTEALGAEIVRYALAADLLKSCIQGRTLSLKARQAQGKTVGRMRATLQFARVAGLFEDTQGFVFGRAQVRVGLARQVQAEPLAGQGLAILEAGVADAAYRHTGGAGQATGRLFGIQVTFFDPQPQVFTGPAQGNVEHFIDLEVFSGRLEDCAAQRFARGTRAQQFEFGHAGSNRATA